VRFICPWCEQAQGTLFSTWTDRAPKRGDAQFCAGCRMGSIYEDDLAQPRRFTVAEYEMMVAMAKRAMN
jgi:hypothetical protein